MSEISITEQSEELSYLTFCGKWQLRWRHFCLWRSQWRWLINVRLVGLLYTTTAVYCLLTWLLELCIIKDKFSRLFMWSLFFTVLRLEPIIDLGVEMLSLVRKHTRLFLACSRLYISLKPTIYLISCTTVFHNLI